MSFSRNLLFASLLSCAFSCAQPGVEYKPTIRLGGVIADSVEAEVNALGYSISGDSDYSSVEVGIGTAAYEEGVLKRLAEVVIAKSTYQEADALEISGGGRFFFSSSQQFSPYFGLYLVSTIFDDLDYVDPFLGPTSFSPGVQVGLRLGLGAEFRLNEQFFIDTSLRYLVPLEPAKSDTYPGIDTEVSGMSLEVGVGFEF
jgi:hypothetical protein